MTTLLTRTRRFTGLKPTGDLQLGNLLGAIRPAVLAQERSDTTVAVVDLHALTVDHDPAAVHAATLTQARVLLAAGLDPRRTTLYVQSHLTEHTGLHYLLECVAADGELRRMVQYKEKSSAGGAVRLSLLTYPVLMAADILLHDAEEVPVGDDQRQHVELARRLAERFNARYGATFTVPTAVNPPVAARIMDLADPTAKMGKTGSAGAGVVFVADDADTVRRKIARAVTDSGGEVRADRTAKPGVTNLLEILAACGGSADGVTTYGQLKAATSEAVVETLRPVQRRYAELAAEPAAVAAVLRDGADRARVRAAATLARARNAMGLVPPFTP
jgi:tryptophanyl-tRNA synthetase